MFERERKTLNELFKRKIVTIPMICAKFNAETKEELFNELSGYLSNDFEYIIENEEYMKNINYLILDILGKLDDTDDFYFIRNLVSTIYNRCKTYLKPYNKKEKKKDANFMRCNKLKELLSYDLDSIDAYLVENDESFMKFKVIKTIIFDLKNPDYLYRLTQTYPDVINITNRDGISLFEYISNYFLDNANALSLDDSKYFKRIIMILLESDSLKLKNIELKDIIKRATIINRISPNKNASFLIESIERHFPNLSGGDKTNCVTYTHVDAPFDIVSKDAGVRKDLRDVFTVTIDGLRNSNLENMLFDDCFALTGSGNDLHVLVSIPDVDLIIDRDSEIDSFMRSLGESVYQRNYKKPLLEYKYAKELSLEKGEDRNALTFDISMDSEGNIKGIEFYESIVRVNYNLTKDKADEFMKHHEFDERLNVLNKMYDLAVKLCRKRKEVVGRRSPAKVIMEEFNILPNLQTALYFEKNGIIFPYKNYLGKLKSGSRKHILQVKEFSKKNNLDEESSELLNSIFDIYNRVFYDTINYGNKTYHGLPCGSVGNPMREYISLETDRLIKDLIIDQSGNYDYWEDRIERDCIEYTETSAKIKELYDIKRGR